MPQEPLLAAPSPTREQRGLPALLRKVYEDNYIGVWRATTAHELEALGWHVRSYAVNPMTDEPADWPVHIRFAPDTSRTPEEAMSDAMKAECHSAE